MKIANIKFQIGSDSIRKHPFNDKLAILPFVDNLQFAISYSFLPRLGAARPATAPRSPKAHPARDRVSRTDSASGHVLANTATTGRTRIQNLLIFCSLRCPGCLDTPDSRGIWRPLIACPAAGRSVWLTVTVSSSRMPTRPRSRRPTDPHGAPHDWRPGIGNAAKQGPPASGVARGTVGGDGRQVFNRMGKSGRHYRACSTSDWQRTHRRTPGIALRRSSGMGASHLSQ